MFPHSDAVYAVHNLRLQDDLKYAAQQRLAATASEAAGIRPLHVAAIAGLGGLAARFAACWRRAVAAPRSQGPNTETGRAGAARAGLA